MTPTQVASAVTEVQEVSNSILAIIEAADPAVALPAETAGSILNLLADLATKALLALTAAQATAISDSTIVSTLTPDATPLTAPNA